MTFPSRRFKRIWDVWSSGSQHLSFNPDKSDSSWPKKHTLITSDAAFLSIPSFQEGLTAYPLHLFQFKTPSMSYLLYRDFSEHSTFCDPKIGTCILNCQSKEHRHDDIPFSSTEDFYQEFQGVSLQGKWPKDDQKRGEGGRGWCCSALG